MTKVEIGQVWRVDDVDGFSYEGRVVRLFDDSRMAELEPNHQWSFPYMTLNADGTPCREVWKLVSNV